MKVILVAAVDSGGGLGKEGQMAWHLPEELALFKAFTKGDVLLMGRKTYQEVGNLPFRFPLVLTRKNPTLNFTGTPVEIPLCERAYTHASMNAALDSIADLKKTQRFRESNLIIMGGAQVYQQALKRPYLIDEVRLTRISHDYGCDTFLDVNLIEDRFTGVSVFTRHTLRDPEWSVTRYVRELPRSTPSLGWSTMG